jgi:predicted ArsR family transcriptional regulator
LTAHTYPATPGYKAPGTSQQAAASMKSKAGTLRSKVAFALRNHSMTADEVAVALGESILSIRPRLSELRATGSIRDTGMRRKNASGKSAVVWSACT